MLTAYFAAETQRLAQECLADVHTLADWTGQRERRRRQLQEMLGLWPLPDRTDLKPVITGRVEHDEFTVEKLHFQALPRVYVTANLYLPKGLAQPAPAILYACGHSRVVTNGVSLGNKTAYQHHGAWFARNGYVCLVLDTLQLGEIQGVHHGTYSEGMWWWNARGYTPAGVEAWFGIRALDYLVSRPEVDATRVGMTGRSGGGAYSWMVAALDDRVKVVAPVAGITDLHNHVVDGCVDGHCDCMFFVNTYRWDFPLLAALVAPRPLLLGNTDKDRIFPLDGVIRLYEKLRRVYRLYGATNALGLLITEGPHQDTQDLQLPVFRWFNRWLKGDTSPVEMAAKKFFHASELRVFDALPKDQLNTRIQETFVPVAQPPPTPLTAAGWTKQQQAWRVALREKCFAGWPDQIPPLDLKLVIAAGNGELRFRAWDFTSQPNVTLRLYLLDRPAHRVSKVTLEVLDQTTWPQWLNAISTEFETELEQERAGLPQASLAPEAYAALKELVASGSAALAWVAPRGIGLTAWAGGEKKHVQIRRRFMLLGQTLDGMRVWDIRRAISALQQREVAGNASITLRARGSMGVNALYAVVFEPSVARLDVSDLPKSHRDGPDYLNVLRILDISQALQLAAEQCAVELR